jgi:hypothetical protein
VTYEGFAASWPAMEESTGEFRLIAPSVDEADLRAIDRGFAPGLPSYLAVFVLAFFSPLAAVILTLALAAFYLPSATLFAGR